MHSADAGPPAGGRDIEGPELADVVSRLRRAMRRAARAADPQGRLSVAQLELLSCLAENPGARPGQLARLLRLAPSSEATLAGGMQRAGLVTREAGGAQDRRTASLRLTPAGESSVWSWQTLNERLVRAAVGTLDPASRQALAAALPALRELAGAIDALADSPLADPSQADSPLADPSQADARPADVAPSASAGSAPSRADDRRR